MIVLADFIVNEKLEVKNIKVEPKKVSAEYHVTNFKGNTSSYEFIYSYKDAYFDSKNASDINLACMMLAQVAINYGLFFKTIEFNGLFDAVDKRFIIDMIENTSKEIITNKLLVKNEFLVPPFNELEAPKQKKYTGADIFFLNTQYSNMKIPNDACQENDYGKYAILSSGGKDSLLTYGIIKEIAEPHPIFINESGRHWFTAVNSYKYYKENEPNTEKPWCNSDRVFNWMLKQLPFIKTNYASIRSDIYPVRLWTVAVFIFGALPIVRKKKIGNILVGNEYDTTQKGLLNGMTHYNGLYDQSKYFDNFLTKYYHKKQWGINQFSILRSLSELLIMKILIKRYPELQRNQISCHAAHESGGRMKPCGKCEKCRRIIGMIMALDEDPMNCGYSIEQIEAGLKELGNKGVKQIGSDASHLYYILLQKGLISKNEHTRKLAKQHSEIIRLRFDNERSNLKDIPVYIRKEILRIFNSYSDGVVQYIDRKWQDVEIDEEFFKNNEDETAKEVC